MKKLTSYLTSTAIVSGLFLFIATAHADAPEYGYPEQNNNWTILGIGFIIGIIVCLAIFGLRSLMKKKNAPIK